MQTLEKRPKGLFRRWEGKRQKMSIGAMLLSMAGGLGLFLFGMRLMSESIEKAAGAKLRGILEMFTKNRFVGMLVGIIFTAVILFIYAHFTYILRDS